MPPNPPLPTHRRMPSREDYQLFLIDELRKGFLLEPEAWDAKEKQQPPTTILLDKEDSWRVLRSAYSSLVDARELADLAAPLHTASRATLDETFAALRHIAGSPERFEKYVLHVGGFQEAPNVGQGQTLYCSLKLLTDFALHAAPPTQNHTVKRVVEGALLLARRSEAEHSADVQWGGSRAARRNFVRWYCLCHIRGFLKTPYKEGGG